MADMPTETKTDAATRVHKYREANAVRFTPDADGLRVGYNDRIAVVTDNMLDCIEQGADTEALTWATFGQVVSYRFRRAW